MDLSDGLADAVGQVAAASGVGAALDAAALPVHPGAVRWFESRGVDPVEAALAGGDDYELLFAVRPRQRRRFLAAIARGGVPATQVGVCTADRRLFVRRAGGSESPLPAGFTHFR
jgi:thiamine-monophosphate kinase